MSETHSLTLRTANNAFASDLYKELFEDTSEKNVVFSPLSLSTVLAMVGLGAQGSTREEIFDALNFMEHSDKAVGSSFKSVLLSELEDKESYTLLTANRVYTMNGFKINAKYSRMLEDYFGAGVEQLNFSTTAKRQQAAAKINKWTESKTNKKIKNLVHPDDLDDDSSILLVSAIYFKGLWKHKFNPDKTREKQFRVTRSKRVEIEMMTMTKVFPYGQLPKLSAAAVAIPYKGDRLAMIIILPNEVNGLSKVRDSLDQILEGGKSLIGKQLVRSDLVKLELPKFKMQATIPDVPDVLESLGMESMFSASKSDFRGITEEEDLCVGNVIHKAYIEVCEEGTEAAAVSAVDKKRTCKGPPRRRSPPRVIRFIVDRPFYFQIVDTDNGDLVLFSGHCNNPL